MPQIHLRFNFRLSRGFVRAATTGLLVLSVAPELGSESVSLTTFYPAPSGVYSRLTTFAGTNLARDSGRVQIGNVAALEPLHVTGRGTFSGELYANGYYPIGAGQVNAASMEVGGTAPSGGNGQATIFLHHHGVIAHQLRYNNGALALEAAGNGYGTNPTPAFFVGGDLVLMGGAACTRVDFGAGFTSCAASGFANSYATRVAGLLARNTTAITGMGSIICCPCGSFPGGVCPF